MSQKNKMSYVVSKKADKGQRKAKIKKAFQKEEKYNNLRSYLY